MRAHKPSEYLRMPSHLAYTLALDHPPGALGHRNMAKFLVLSLLRTRFDGEIVVFKTSPAPLFMVPRAGVREITIDPGEHGDEHFWNYAQSWKFRVHELLDVTGCDKVLYLDADCLALRNINLLLKGDWDLAFYREPGSCAADEGFNCFISEEEAATLACNGVNGGVLAVAAGHFHEVMAEWQRIHFGPAQRPKYFTDQAALNRLVIDSGLRHRVFTREEVSAPFSHDPRAQDYLAAGLVHLAGSTDLHEKLRFMLGLYVSTFFFDPQATLLNILEI
ncbi:MAG: hypothetical protein JWO94_604 [Verrucomicrobiaceae bacterium]|nr:hypothetical protein [Verrucomicrobiaceae bacterium]